MPELPEVETVRRVLEPQLVSRRFTGATLITPSVIAHPTPACFSGSVSGQTVAALRRRGKFLQILLDDGGQLVVHFRMTGSLVVAPEGWPYARHTHVILPLDNGCELRFEDMRRFGRLWLLAKHEDAALTGMNRLGLEPFDPRLCADLLQARWGHSQTPIKHCLLDQSVVCGIGNIYSDEILFAAGVRPNRPAASLSCAEWAKLAKTIPERLMFFTKTNAISPDVYLQSLGRDYQNTPYLQVYGHGAQPCPRCGRPLTKAVIRGRSSVYCETCQL